MPGTPFASSFLASNKLNKSKCSISPHQWSFTKKFFKVTSPIWILIWWHEIGAWDSALQLFATKLSKKQLNPNLIICSKILTCSSTSKSSDVSFEERTFRWNGPKWAVESDLATPKVNWVADSEAFPGLVPKRRAIPGALGSSISNDFFFWMKSISILAQRSWKSGNPVDLEDDTNLLHIHEV